ncbi:MAG: DUF4174 domain-containing protein [Candidatus Sumerlaeia bacterium]|nr:DUF4174 domain-containing protein [Candidatus Sumerlaeia bacterium]
MSKTRTSRKRKAVLSADVRIPTRAGSPRALAALVLVLALAAGACRRGPKGTPVEDSLDQFLWKNRLVVLFAEDTKDPEYLRQLTLLNLERDGLEERQTLIVPVQGSGAGLRGRFGLEPGGFQLALVGKDGGVKLRASDPVDPSVVFDLIDSMPMRQAELRGGD